MPAATTTQRRALKYGKCSTIGVVDVDDMLLKVVGIYATSTHHASGSTHKKKLMGFMSDLVNGKSSFRLSMINGYSKSPLNVNYISQTTDHSYNSSWPRTFATGSCRIASFEISGRPHGNPLVPRTCNLSTVVNMIVLFIAHLKSFVFHFQIVQVPRSCNLSGVLNTNVHRFIANLKSLLSNFKGLHFVIKEASTASIV